MKVKCIIEMAKDGGFSCYTNESFEGFALFGYGDSVTETKEDFLSSYEEIVEMRKEENKETPVLEFDWEYDLASFFNYFSILNVSELARKSGINDSQLRRYKAGQIKASQKTFEKLSNTISRVGHELISAKIHTFN